MRVVVQEETYRQIQNLFGVARQRFEDFSGSCVYDVDCAVQASSNNHVRRLRTGHKSRDSGLKKNYAGEKKKKMYGELVFGTSLQRIDIPNVYRGVQRG